MKKIISVILCVVMIFTVSSTAFAEKKTDYVPIIEVYGFGRTNLIKDKDTESEMSVFMPSSELLVPAILKIVFPLMVYLLTGNGEYFSDKLMEAGNDVLGYLRFDNDGEPEYDDISLEEESGNFTFRYDWRYDVTDVADRLNEYVEKVKEETGCEKVAIVPESMGGAVTMAYIYEYGFDSVDSLVLRSSAMEGITTVGGLFTGDLHVDTDSVIGYINGFLLGGTTDAVFKRWLVSTLGRIPVSVIAGFLNKYFDGYKEKVFDECLCDLFGNLPGLWSFVPDDTYEQAKVYMLDSEENAKLIEKIDVFHNQIRPEIPSMIEEMQENGVKVAIISHYGLYCVPIVPEDNYNSDFLVDTKYTSMGATCSKLGETLGDGYVQAVADGHNHLSPDGIIDASTCAFPDNTWFVKGMVHTWYNRGYQELVEWIIYESENASVYENPLYPQFLYNNVEERAVEPLRADHPDPISTNLFRAIIK